MVCRRNFLASNKCWLFDNFEMSSFKSTSLTTVSKGAVASAAKVNPLMAVTEASNSIVTAWRDYKILAEQEKTKRFGIAAMRDVKLKELNDKRELMELYLVETFKERRSVVSEMLTRLDQGIESGNDHLIELALATIQDTLRQSPLRDIGKLIVDINDPNVDVIDI